MASSSADYFSQSRPAVRSRQASNITPAGGSPRTPLLGRSISGQFGSPGTPYRGEQEDLVVYELGARHVSAGFAGESKPRCIRPFTPEQGRRVGDFRSYTAGYEPPRKKQQREEDWGVDHELYRTDIRSLDMGLVEDKLERAVRNIHYDFLQLPSLRPLKAVLAVPSLLPTPLLEIMLKVLFNHYAQPPSVMILTTPILACVGAGLRNALVVDIGWEETAVTAVGEFKEIFQRRSIRAGKMLTREMARVLEREAKSQDNAQGDDSELRADFTYAEEVTRRMAWCRSLGRKLAHTDDNDSAKLIKLPHPASASRPLNIFFTRLSEPAETTFFPVSASDFHDDHDSALPKLLYATLLALPLDLRAACISRITFTGGVAALPGLKHRALQELQHLLNTRGWDRVHNYGSRADKMRKRVLAQRDANASVLRKQQEREEAIKALKEDERGKVAVHERLSDEVGNALAARVERQAVIKDSSAKSTMGVVRGVQTLGPWAGASLVAGLRVKGVHEVEREDFLKHGWRDGTPGANVL